MHRFVSKTSISLHEFISRASVSVYGVYCLNLRGHVKVQNHGRGKRLFRKNAITMCMRLNGQVDGLGFKYRVR